MPYTTIVSGTVITASWANANVRDQVVTVFATDAARTSAIGSPVQGMLSYRIDGKLLEVYDGAVWVPVQMRLQARKSVDKILNNTTTLQNDDALTWTVQANAFYTIDLHLRYSSSTTADLKIGWSMPATAGLTWSFIGNDAALVATITGDYASTATPALGGVGGVSWAHITGVFATGSTSGQLTLQWAQNTAEVSNTTMCAHSYGYLTRVA